MSELVAHDADVNQADQAGRTPLIVAAEQGCLALVRLLAERGAGLDHAYREDELPDAVSAALRSPALDELEVDEMCDPYRGNTALIQVRGENPCIFWYRGNTPLIQVQRGKNTALFGYRASTSLI